MLLLQSHPTRLLTQETNCRSEPAIPDLGTLKLLQVNAVPFLSRGYLIHESCSVHLAFPVNDLDQARTFTVVARCPRAVRMRSGLTSIFSPSDRCLPRALETGPEWDIRG